VSSNNSVHASKIVRTRIPTRKTVAFLQLWSNCWMKMPLSKQVGLGPGHIVLDGDPAPSAAPPTFGPCLLWPNGRPSQQLLSSCFCVILCNF